MHGAPADGGGLTERDDIDGHVPITFAPGYAGPKQLVVFAHGPGGSSGWQDHGDGTVRARLDTPLPARA